ncbi:MAG TPA: U32 family peptidase [Candidatus Limiplasma pullistercoris]|nr:U32 family peptidase [Candidatus Limiplasma pullistercoris]
MPLLLPELLCPAGDEAALRAAVDSGANAVYLGYRAFGARASATNFDAEALEAAVRYAHLYHVRVYVTVNTLVKPDEMQDLRAALGEIAATGADAAIVQDLGVADLVRREFPVLALHASTQMAICNAEGARLARTLGFSRVVLARECALKDVRAVAETGIETEVFVHGALCTAVSGRCLMSSMSGGRSGNRGRCAQPCRQGFRLDGMRGPLLSLRDLCLLDDLPVLCASGVRSLKVEGRLKSPEYVAVVTSVYRQALDAVARGDFRPDPAQREQLLQIFNRGGFTRGHILGAEDADLVTPDRVSHEGLPLGKVQAVRGHLAALHVNRALHDGDSLQLRGAGESCDLRYSGPDVPAGGTASLRLRPGTEAKPGMQVARLADARQLDQARAHAPRLIPVSMAARFALGEPMTLALTDGEVSVTVTGPVAQAAKSRPSAEADARRQLDKLGGTPFTLEDGTRLQLLMDEGIFLPVSALNALRRDGVERLIQARTEAFALAGRPLCHDALPAVPARPQPDSPIGPETLAVIFSDPTLAEDLSQAGATLLCFAPRTFTPEALARELPRLPRGTWLRLPPQMTQRTQDACLAVIRSHADRLGGVMAESVGQLGLSLPLPALAGEGVPATNPPGVETVRMLGACGFVLWPEWTFSEQKGLTPLPLPSLLKVYGRETLMLLNHCPERVRRGLRQGRADCALCANEAMVCAKADPALTDRLGYRFPLTRTRFPEGCELSVLGALPTDLRARDADRRALGAGMLLHFTVESAREQLSLTRAYAALLSGASCAPAAFETTLGHWTRGVE